MKKLLLPLISMLLFTACQKQMPDEQMFSAKNVAAGKNNFKINICHKTGNGSSHMINISINAWPAHQSHGDIRLDDQDGDGYVPFNGCGFGQMGDCNDNNAAIKPGAAEICDNGIDDNCNGKVDENCYPSVTICNQVWMQKNLNVARYRNGDPIPNVTDPEEWGALTTGAYCYYNNDSATYAATYGKLYNTYAVMDPRGLAPEGWHVPFSAEWETLINCLGGFQIAGGPLKETGFSHWASPNSGATNSSGFTGLPGGMRYGLGGEFYGIGLYAFFGRSLEQPVKYPANRQLSFQGNGIGYSGLVMNEGFSIRCVKD
jgi:uncharacterized protein (TIGR02145 family)